MSRAYGKKIYDVLNENKLKSLDILLEQDEDEADSSDASDKSDKSGDSDASDDSEQIDSVIDDALGDEPSEDSESSSDKEDNQDAGGDDVAELTKAELDQRVKEIENLTDFIRNNTTKPEQDIENKMEIGFAQASGIGEITAETTNIVNSFKTLFTEDAEGLSKLTKSMDNLDTALKDSSETLAVIEKGVNINMDEYVDFAINQYQSFDSLFPKWEIVKKAALNVIASKGGKNAKASMDEFEKLYSEKLNKIHGIESESHHISSNKSYVAAGATKQG